MSFEDESKKDNAINNNEILSNQIKEAKKANSQNLDWGDYNNKEGYEMDRFHTSCRDKYDRDRDDRDRACRDRDFYDKGHDQRDCLNKNHMARIPWNRAYMGRDYMDMNRNQCSRYNGSYDNHRDRGCRNRCGFDFIDYKDDMDFMGRRRSDCGLMRYQTDDDRMYDDMSRDQSRRNCADNWDIYGDRMGRERSDEDMMGRNYMNDDMMDRNNMNGDMMDRNNMNSDRMNRNNMNGDRMGRNMNGDRMDRNQMNMPQRPMQTPGTPQRPMQPPTTPGAPQRPMQPPTTPGTPQRSMQPPTTPGAPQRPTQPNTPSTPQM